MDSLRMNHRDIFAEYMRLRQNGASSENAAKRLRAHADALTTSERQALSRMVQNWEAGEGKNFGAKPLVANNQASTQPPPSVVSTIRSITPRTTQTVSEAPEQQICPKCSKVNDPSEKYCYSCGQLLSGTTTITKALEDEADPHITATHFGAESKVLLTVRGAYEITEFLVPHEVTIGRAEKSVAVQPDIDLTQYKAADLGVSRVHASLKREGQTLTISDLNSTNGTFINGQKLHSHEIRVLRDGDEIRLGRLKIRINFKHQVKRLPKS